MLSFLLALPNLVAAGLLWYYLIIKRLLVAHKRIRFGGIMLWILSHLFILTCFMYDVAAFMFFCSIAVAAGSYQVAYSCNKQLREMDAKRSIQIHHTPEQTQRKLENLRSQTAFEREEVEREHDRIRERKAELKLQKEHKDRLIPQEATLYPAGKFYMQSELAYTFKNVLVHGTMNLGDKEHLPKVKVNQSIILAYESNEQDQYDDCVISVLDGWTNKELGYLENGSDAANKAKEYIDAGNPAEILVSGVSDDNIYLNIQFYDLLKRKYRKSKTFRLSGVNREDYEYLINHSLVDEQIHFDYDDRKKRYLASCDYEIGYLTDSIEDIIEQEHIALVSDVELSDNLKWRVKVTIYYDLLEGSCHSAKYEPCLYCGGKFINIDNGNCLRCGAPM